MKLSDFKGSAFYLQGVLFRWARKQKLDIGNKSYAGLSFFVEPSENPFLKEPYFVIEHRGPGLPPIRITNTYVSRGRKNGYRQQALKQMESIFCALKTINKVT